ncbi:sigma factor [Falsiroseomonas sp.]|uniref:sigma factor n=1 Tax=Falsiroseomonas sp. TaxID=2870721 RepID=UPI0027184DB8|nr:sigma factor [Falsiroseomonas sp.]MDO9502719.1 sigma factor [Falsiroseomonas sp.]
MEQTIGTAGLDARILKHIRSKARRLARTAYLPGMDAEDIEQDLILDLWRRRHRFNPERASFRTFADRIVAHRVATLTSPTARLRAERTMVCLDAPLDDPEGGTLADTLTQPVDVDGCDTDPEMALDVRRFVASLTPALRRCCSILAAPNVVEATAAAGLHRSSVYENAGRLRKLAAAAGLRDYVAAPRHFAHSAGR